MIPHEIRYTLRMFYDNLDDGNYIDAVECLNELHQYNVHMTDERSKIHAALAAHKYGIVRRLLRFMHHYPIDEVKHFIPLTISSLRAFDINWRDLNIIENTVTSDKPVTEALGSPVGNIVFGMQNALRRGNDRGVAHRILDLWHGSAEEKQRASDMLADVDQLLLSWVERQLGSDDMFAVQDGLNLVHVLPPSEDWVDITILLNKYKKNIMMYLIKCMQRREFDIVEYRIPKLHEWGISWPDLKHLKTSADAELKNNKTTDRRINEADSRADFSTVFRNRSNEEGGNRFSLTADEYVDHISKLLQHGYKDNQVVLELATLGRRYRDAIKNWPELAALIDKNKNKIFRILSSNFEKEYFNHYLLDFAGALSAIGVHWPEIKPMIEKNKYKIMQVLIGLIEDDADIDFIESQIDALKSYGIKWPDLRIIDKSTTANKNKLTEGNNSSKIWPDDIRSMFMDMLKDDSLGIVLYHIELFHADIEKVPELKEFLDKRKHKYIRIIMDNLMSNAGDYGGAEQYLRRLEDAKVKWPDLKHLRKTLNTTYDPGTDSNAP